MPTFKPPYGTTDQHVYSPAQHFGYCFIVARLVDGGSQADYIKRACADAQEERAPKDAVVREENGAWRTRAQLASGMYGRRLDTYAAALTQYEEELKAECRKGAV